MGAEGTGWRGYRLGDVCASHPHVFMDTSVLGKGFDAGADSGEADDYRRDMVSCFLRYSGLHVTSGVAAEFLKRFVQHSVRGMGVYLAEAARNHPLVQRMRDYRQVAADFYDRIASRVFSPEGREADLYNAIISGLEDVFMERGLSCADRGFLASALVSSVLREGRTAALTNDGGIINAFDDALGRMHRASMGGRRIAVVPALDVLSLGRDFEVYAPGIRLGVGRTRARMPLLVGAASMS